MAKFKNCKKARIGIITTYDNTHRYATDENGNAVVLDSNGNKVGDNAMITLPEANVNAKRFSDSTKEAIKTSRLKNTLNSLDFINRHNITNYKLDDYGNLINVSIGGELYDVHKFGNNWKDPFTVAIDMSRYTLGMPQAGIAANYAKQTFPELVKSIYRKANDFGSKVGYIRDANNLRNRNSAFRIVDEPAIIDAINTGIIRAKTGLHHGTTKYVRNNYPEFVKDTPGWENMTAEQLKQALTDYGIKLPQISLSLRNSTNHGGTVGYNSGQPYRAYSVTKQNRVIETPLDGNIDFVVGHGGKRYGEEFSPKDFGMPLVIEENGSIKNATGPAKGSSYWQYNPYVKGFLRHRFEFGGQVNKRRKAEYGEESIVLPEANIAARRPRWYNKIGKIIKQSLFPDYDFILDKHGRYVINKHNLPDNSIPYSKQHSPFNFSTTGGTVGHERDNIVNVKNGKAGERDFLQMMGLSKLDEGKYLYKNRNKSETDKREYLKWCAENANMMNRNFGKPTVGDAWTRHGFYGDSAIVVNPNVDKRNYSEVFGLNFNRVNKDNAQYVQDNIDNVKLENGDIVDIARKSAYERKAYNEGDYNRSNSHTGTIINRNGNTYVFHYDGEGKIKMDPIGDLIGNSIWNPSMITGIRRPGTKEHPYVDNQGNITYNKKQFGGQMKKYNPRHKAFIGAIINAATSVASGVANAVMQHKQQLKQNRQDNYEHGLQTAGVLDQLIANQDVVNQQLRNKVAFKYGGRKKCEMGSLAKGILFSALTGAGGIAGAFADRAVQKHDMNKVQILPGVNATTTQTEQNIQQQPVINTSQQTSMVQTDTTTPYDWNDMYNAQINNNATTTKRFGGRTQMFMCGGRTKRNRRK